MYYPIHIRSYLISRGWLKFSFPYTSCTENPIFKLPQVQEIERNKGRMSHIINLLSFADELCSWHNPNWTQFNTSQMDLARTNNYCGIHLNKQKLRIRGLCKVCKGIYSYSFYSGFHGHLIIDKLWHILPPCKLSCGKFCPCFSHPCPQTGSKINWLNF